MERDNEYTSNQASEQIAQLARGGLSNPYLHYKILRSADPVHWSELLSAWVLTRYADVVPALRNPDFSSERAPTFMRQLPETVRQEMNPLSYHLSKWFGWNDPPYQTRLREAVSKAFTSEVVARMNPRIQNIVDELIGNVRGLGQMDVICDMANPLPVTVIAELLGVPQEYREKFKRGADDIVAFFGAGRAHPDTAERAQRGILTINEFLKDILEQRRRHPENDLITNLLAVEQEGHLLTEEELIGTCVFFLVAGHETTTDLIGNGMLALLQNPDQMVRLRDKPSLIGSAVEEFLRYDSPVQRIWRLATRDCEIDGKRVLKGQVVLSLIGAANRDPAEFPDPDQLDIGRRDNHHAAFGVGIHFCVGATLARIEAQIAIQTLLRRLPFLRLVAKALEWKPTMSVRSLKALPVVFEV